MTQRLKLEPSPISQTHVDKVFSPVCECESDAAQIEFTLRRADHLRIGIRIDGRELTIADGEFGKGVVRARWNGRDAAGAVVPDRKTWSSPPCGHVFAEAIEPHALHQNECSKNIGSMSSACGSNSSKISCAS